METDSRVRGSGGSKVGGQRLRVFLAALALVAARAAGAPYLPASDAVVLERLPAAGAAKGLEPLRVAVKNDPKDLRSALLLAQGYLQIGRETSDPRFVSYAQAALAPWLEANPSAAVLVLQATALQSAHRFDEAIALLDRALEIEPRNAQAWLTKATLLQVQGAFAKARAACQPLLTNADQLIALACLSSVNSMTGRLEQSYQRLHRVARASSSGDPELSAWVTGQLAEMAVRLGDLNGAERHFKDALQLTPADPYLRAAYADLLLLQNRHGEVVEMLEDDASQDVLLLRLAVAAPHAAAADASRWARAFDARRRATRADDNPHLREHARFLLDVLDRPRDALALARKNWGNQREPPDIHLYLRAALRARSSGDVHRVQEWVRQTGYEDRTLPRASQDDAAAPEKRRQATSP